MSAVRAGPPLVIDPGTCRCCGATKRCRFLTIEYQHLGNKEIYSDMIMDCFGLLISYMDSKPEERLICATCVVRLREAMTFKKQVLLIEEAFLQMKMLENQEASSSLTYPETPEAEVEVKTEMNDPDSPHDNDALADDCHDSTPFNEIPSPMNEDSNDDTPLCTLASKKKGFLNAAISSPTSSSPNLILSSYDLKLKSKLASPQRLKSKDIMKIRMDEKTRLKHALVKNKEKVMKIRSDDKIRLKNALVKSKAELMKIRTDEKLRLKNALVKEITQKTDGAHKMAVTSKPTMTRIQEMVRNGDTENMIEHNILSIVEHSYACPFKCRHNTILCYYCGEYFSDPELLRHHTLNNHNPKKFKINEKIIIKIDLSRIDCRLCPKKIETLEEFKKHLSFEHKKKYYHQYKDSILPFKLTKELKCALCDEKFEYFHALNKHMNVHFRNFVCDQCGLGFVDRGRFLMHQQRHETGDYPCGECGKVFKAQTNREIHIDRVHKKIPHVYCPKCNVKLMTYHAKLKHLVEVHGEEPLRFPCSLCERVFNNRRMLTIHHRKDHLKDYRYQCQYCSQKFFTRFALNNHLPTHTGERNFKCKVCQKSYPRLKTLNDHMRIHTNDRRYRCAVCGQGFIQNCSLKGHMKSQHPEYVFSNSNTTYIVC